MPRKTRRKFQSNGLCVAYLRVSTGRQAKSGLGLMSQGDICKRRAKLAGLAFRDIHQDIADPPRQGHFVDAGESAFNTVLSKRPAGSLLLASIQSGDTLIVSKLDRAWRNVVDFITTADELTAQGVRLVVCSPNIDMGSATGRMLAIWLANLAEWESGRKSERIRDALQAKKARKTLVAASRTGTTESLDSDWRPSETSNLAIPDGKAGRIYIYLRCSHRESADSGLGLIVQLDACRDFADSLNAQNPMLALETIFTDPAKSARYIDLRDRPSGKQLDDVLRDGDHVVFSTLDRGFRSVRDLANTIPDWQKRGIHVHFASEGISMDDPGGQMLATAIVQFAQMEADLASQRNAEARAQLASRGRFCGGREPPFWKVQQVTSKKSMLVLDRKKILAHRLAIHLQVVRGMKISQALIRVEELFAERENRPAAPQSGVSPFTPMSARFPKDYERDCRGKIFPYLNKKRWYDGKKLYEEALAAWRLQQKHRREALEGVCQNPQSSK